MTHPLATTAGLKRIMTPGSTLRITNHLRPEASRLTVVLPKTNTVDLVTHAEGAKRGSHLAWPKRGDLRPDEHDDRTVHVDRDGDPFLTITVMESEQLDALQAPKVGA